MKQIAIKILDKITNGDMITAIFPNFEALYDPEIEQITGHLDGVHRVYFNPDWWNAPYETESTK